jgi:hypothetical protein
MKFLESDEMIELLENALENNPELVNDVHLAKECLVKAKEARDKWRNKLTFTRFDTIFSAFDQLRHIYCRVFSCRDLLMVISNIRLHMETIDLEPDIRHKYKQTLEKIEKQCTECQLGLPDYIGKLRCELEIISRHVSSIRQQFWRKVNLLRTRLFWTAAILFVLLGSSISLVPAILSSHGNIQITWKLMVGFVVSGALGGVFSALRSTEPLKGDEASYYIQRLLLWLRPIIGACAGVIICLLNLSGIVSLTIISGTSNQEAAYLVLAFLAGFSERFFVGQLEGLLNQEDVKRK